MVLQSSAQRFGERPQTAHSSPDTPSLLSPDFGVWNLLLVCNLLEDRNWVFVVSAVPSTLPDTQFLALEKCVELLNVLSSALALKLLLLVLLIPMWFFDYKVYLLLLLDLLVLI